MPIQQMLLGVGASTKTYIDEVFNLDAWVGTNTNKTITNGIDLLGEGGLVMIKTRQDVSREWALADTERGTNKLLRTDNADENKSVGESLKAWYSTGFKLGGAAQVNWSSGGSGDEYIGYTFRKSPGFFDCIKFTGSGGTSSSPQTINHSLGSIPGMIICKQMTDAWTNWFVYHKSLGENKFSILNNANAPAGYNGGFKNITSSSFQVFDSNSTNTKEFIAYVFAGGTSGASTAYSMRWDGNSDRLNVGSSSSKSADLNFGSGDLSIECWIKAESSQTDKPNILCIGDDDDQGEVNFCWDHEDYANKISFWSRNKGSTPFLVSDTKTFNGDGQWHHIAVTRASNVWRLFIDGVLEETATWTGNTTDANEYLCIGNTTTGVQQSNVSYFNGRISNVRIVKGTAVYTSSFRLPTEPLANVTNTVLLTVNSSSRTGSTVTPLTITEQSLPDPTSESPFDDPAGFTFGDSSEGVIKCGTYTTDSNEDSTIELGWEPHWILTKRTDSSGDWRIYDSLRGISNAQDVAANEGRSYILEVNDTATEVNSSKIGLTSTGFYADQDGANRTYIYVAIRRPDGYVGKPADAGTNVFAIDTGNSSSTIPTFDSGFPVDFGIMRTPGSADNNNTGARLTSRGGMRTNQNNSETNYGAQWAWDSTAGWVANSNYQSATQSFMWKRGAGFDVVAYAGGKNRYGSLGSSDIKHSLGKTPEMIWVKRRNSSENWMVYHKGFNGGTNPENYWMNLNGTTVDTYGFVWGQSAPTSTYFTVADGAWVNGSGSKYLALLFASVDGISKCGEYSGSSSSQTISLGFQPKFLIIKNLDDTRNWQVLDTTRGWGSGNDCRLWLDLDEAQICSSDVGAPTSTGFTLTGGNPRWSDAGDNYIYYAHA